MSRAVLPLLLLVCSAAPAQAAEPCAEEANTVAVNACLTRWVAAQDEALARAVARLRAAWREQDAVSGSPPVLPAFDAAQAAWEAYRRRECAARALIFGSGTGAAAASGRCELALSVQREAELASRW